MENFRTTKKTFLVVLFMAILIASFWACKESSFGTLTQPLDETKIASLAKTYVSEVSDVEYESFNISYKALNEKELKRFYEIVINNEARTQEKANELLRNNEILINKSIKKFGLPLNKLNIEQQGLLFEEIEQQKRASAKVSALCPTIAYGGLRASIVTTYNTSCSDAYLINVKGQNDCDYECAFSGLNATYSKIPIYGTTARMRTLLNSFQSGSIMARQLSSNGYILLGAARTLYYLASSNPVLTLKTELKMKK